MVTSNQRATICVLSYLTIFHRWDDTMLISMWYIAQNRRYANLSHPLWSGGKQITQWIVHTGIIVCDILASLNLKLHNMDTNITFLRTITSCKRGYIYPYNKTLGGQPHRSHELQIICCCLFLKTIALIINVSPWVGSIPTCQVNMPWKANEGSTMARHQCGRCITGGQQVAFRRSWSNKTE